VDELGVLLPELVVQLLSLLELRPGCKDGGARNCSLTRTSTAGGNAEKSSLLMRGVQGQMGSEKMLLEVVLTW
jgi:hypothetical protein